MSDPGLDTGSSMGSLSGMDTMGSSNIGAMGDGGLSSLMGPTSGLDGGISDSQSQFTSALNNYQPGNPTSAYLMQYASQSWTTAIGMKSQIVALLYSTVKSMIQNIR